MIGSFISIVCAYCLLFFNVPYQSGKDIADMSSSGLWRGPFTLLSRAGEYFYKLLAKLTQKLTGTLHAVADIIIFTAALFAVTKIYDLFTVFIFGPEVIDASGFFGSELFEKLSKGITVLRVLYYGNIFSFIAMSIVYWISNVIFFSFLYGFLSVKVQENPWFSRLGVSSGDGILHKIIDAVLGFFRNLAVLCGLYKPLVFASMLVIIFIGTVVGYMFDFIDYGPIDLFYGIIEQMNIIPIIASFFITLIMGKIGEIAGRQAIRAMPAAVQRRISAVERRGRTYADRVRSQRLIERSEERQILHVRAPRGEPVSAPPYSPPASSPQPHVSAPQHRTRPVSAVEERDFSDDEDFMEALKYGVEQMNQAASSGSQQRSSAGRRIYTVDEVLEAFATVPELHEKLENHLQNSSYKCNPGSILLLLDDCYKYLDSINRQNN